MPILGTKEKQDPSSPSSSTGIADGLVQTLAIYVNPFLLFFSFFFFAILQFLCFHLDY